MSVNQRSLIIENFENQSVNPIFFILGWIGILLTMLFGKIVRH